eukprot:SAG25_NODE_11859_length_293_cov_0.804124_1_plen_21_part_10
MAHVDKDFLLWIGGEVQKVVN